MEQIRFREEQRFGRWVDVATILATLGVAAAQLTLMSDSNPPGAMFGWSLFWAGVVFILANLFRMTTEVTEREVRVWFGRWFPYYRRRIPLDTIRNVRVVSYSPLRDAGGWGIRWGRFEGEFCAFLNASGNRGILLELDNGKRLIIGSGMAEGLCATLRSRPPA